MASVSYQDITEAVVSLKALLPQGFTPAFGIIGGSGLSALEQAIQEPRVEVSYGLIKGFPVSTGMCPIISPVTDKTWLRSLFVQFES